METLERVVVAASDRRSAKAYTRQGHRGARREWVVRFSERRETNKARQRVTKDEGKLNANYDLEAQMPTLLRVRVQGRSFFDLAVRPCMYCNVVIPHQSLRCFCLL